VLAGVGLTDQDVARQITGWVAALGSTENVYTETEPTQSTRQKFE
jgi:1-deoxy-D-xylulose-5-phosphate synthase